MLPTVSGRRYAFALLPTTMTAPFQTTFITHTRTTTRALPTRGPAFVPSGGVAAILHTTTLPPTRTLGGGFGRRRVADPPPFRVVSV